MSHMQSAWCPSSDIMDTVLAHTPVLTHRMLSSSHTRPIVLSHVFRMLSSFHMYSLCRPFTCIPHTIIHLICWEAASLLNIASISDIVQHSASALDEEKRDTSAMSSALLYESVAQQNVVISATDTVRGGAAFHTHSSFIAWHQALDTLDKFDEARHLVYISHSAPHISVCHAVGWPRMHQGSV